MDSTEFSIFTIDPEEFNFHLNGDDADDSKFDQLLKLKWEEGLKNSIFRYKLNIRESKRLEGKYQFLAQLNLDRAHNRRTPENIESIAAPFDSNRFNFTKINDREIYACVDNGDGNHVIAANVSPIEYGHCLFLPDRLKCLPQRVTKFSIIKIIELVLLSKSPYLRAVFNSLCAYASVNHLHWHLYFLNWPMILEYQPLENFLGPIFIIKDYPAKGFCIKLSSFVNKNISFFSSTAYLLISYLQQNLIAHNVYITRAKESNDSFKYSDIRIYIWARQSSSGIKNTSEFLPAVCELFGHLPIRTEDGYNKITEKDVAKCLDEVTNEIYSNLVTKLRNDEELKNALAQISS